MRHVRVVVLACVVSATACRRDASPPSPSAVAVDASPVDLAADERARIVSAACGELVAHYVFPDVGTKMAATLRERAARGDYDRIVSAAELARVVTEAMREVSHDAHAMLEREPPPGAATAEDEAWDRRVAKNRASSGFGATVWLPGKIAHLAIGAFEPVDAARETIATRMTEVADADALILDLRDNRGGDPATVALVASYVLGDTPVHLNDMWWRDDGSTDAFFSLRDVKGKRFGATKPVVVVTDRSTFSAAEEFAYDLQALHRATIVGEKTRGGAHPVAIRKLSAVFTLRVPTGRAINPITKTNWEGTGVAPDVPAPPGEALATAERLARKAVAR